MISRQRRRRLSVVAYLEVYLDVRLFLLSLVILLWQRQDIFVRDRPRIVGQQHLIASTAMLAQLLDRVEGLDVLLLLVING